MFANAQWSDSILTYLDIRSVANFVASAAAFNCYRVKFQQRMTSYITNYCDVVDWQRNYTLNDITYCTICLKINYMQVCSVGCAIKTLMYRLAKLMADKETLMFFAEHSRPIIHDWFTNLADEKYVGGPVRSLLELSTYFTYGVKYGCKLRINLARRDCPAVIVHVWNALQGKLLVIPFSFEQTDVKILHINN